MACVNSMSVVFYDNTVLHVLRCYSPDIGGVLGIEFQILRYRATPDLPHLARARHLMDEDSMCDAPSPTPSSCSRS